MLIASDTVALQSEICFSNRIDLTYKFYPLFVSELCWKPLILGHGLQFQNEAVYVSYAPLV